jgi:hypothetical protein
VSPSPKVQYEREALTEVLAKLIEKPTQELVRLATKDAVGL